MNLETLRLLCSRPPSAMFDPMPSARNISFQTHCKRVSVTSSTPIHADPVVLDTGSRKRCPVIDHLQENRACEAADPQQKRPGLLWKPLQCLLRFRKMPFSKTLLYSMVSVNRLSPPILAQCLLSAITVLYVCGTIRTEIRMRKLVDGQNTTFSADNVQRVKWSQSLEHY